METYFEMVKRHNAMEAEEKAAFNTIWEALQAGDSFGKFAYWKNYSNEPYYYPMFDNYLWIAKGYDGADYIVWRYYGQSAHKKTRGDLKWIIETIFRTSAVDFLKEYESRETFKAHTTAEDVRRMVEEKAAECGVNNPLSYVACDCCIYTGKI